jgi:putative ABC transport system permease protein
MQFLLEAFLINLASLVMAATLYQLGFRHFTNLAQKAIPNSSLLEESWFWLGMVSALVFGTLLSGGYSAFMLSSLKAASIMKGKFYTSEGGAVLRKGLIVFQFFISVGLISCTLGVYNQLVYMKNQAKGYDPSQKLIVRVPGTAGENYAHHYWVFKTALQKLPDIGQITASFLSPGDAREKGGSQVSNKDELEKFQIFPINVVDEDYLETYKIQLLHGRGFSKEFPSDKDAAVITEDVALQMGFDPVESALQKKIVIAPNWLKKEVSIIGIVKNISLYSSHRERTGVVFILGVEKPIFSGAFNYLTIEVNNISHLRENLVSIEDIYKSHFPGIPFTYFFLDDYFNTQYRAEEQYGKAFTIASCLAIFIACLGLFGLSSFMVQQRTKEIGIRKVLGATIQNILMLLSKDYIILVCLAGLIALPFAYFTLNWWLESYMHRIELSWWLFVLPVVIVIGIALFTVCFQTIRAALTNPANVLKNE